MAQFFNDLFTRTADANVTDHVSDSGHGWVMAKGDVIPKVFASVDAVANGGASVNPSIIRPNTIAPAADAKTSATMHYDSTNFEAVALTVRMSADGNTGYMAAFHKASLIWALHRLSNVSNPLANPVLTQTAAQTYAQGNNVPVELSVEGAGATVTVTLKLNGAAAITFADTDAARVTTAGYPGLVIKSGSAAGSGIWFNDMSADTLTAATAPLAPTVGTISAGDGTVTVPFTLNGDGGAAITGVTATVTPGGQSATGTTSPLTITGVANGTAVTAKVKATNSVGTGPESAASNSVTPSASVTVSGVTVAPSAPTVNGGATQQFSATVNGTGSVPQGVTWTMTGAGTISASGLYTAPASTSSAQSATITATSTHDNTKSGSTTVTVPATVAVTVSGVAVSPSAPTVAGGATQQFTVTVSGTGTVPQGVTWAATLGTITTSGLYTAPASTAAAQSATITATSTHDTSKSGTATVTVPAVVVQVYPVDRALKYADRVKDTTSTTGLGTITLANAAPAKMVTFGGAYAVGTKNIPYCIEEQNGSAWEFGVGTLLTASTLSRDTIISSSAAGAPIDFAAGVKDVFCVATARAFSTFAVKDYIDLRDFDVDPTFTNDSTAGIQAAILKAYQTNRSKIKCPDGRFKIAGPRGVSNAQLYIPNTLSTGPSRTIMFEGASPPNLEMQGLVSMPVTTNGTIFESTILGNANSSLIRGEAGSTTDPSGMRWNYTNVGFRNMGFRTNVAGGANPMTAVNLDFFSQIVEFDNIRIDVNTPIISCPNPASVNSSGLIIPPVNNHAQLNIGSVLIAGYTNGIVIGEHTHVKSIIVLGCVNAVVVPVGNHGSMISHLLVECSKNSIFYQGNHPLVITCYSTEHNQDGNWFDFSADILHGGAALDRKIVILQSTVVKSHVGIDDTDFTTNNAACYRVIVGAGAN